MSESGCVATVELTVGGSPRKVPCPNEGVLSRVAGESFSVDVVLCGSHKQIAESEGFRVTAVENPVDGVQGSERDRVI